MSPESVAAWLVVQWVALRRSAAGPDGDPADRGDVPGWVMITVMTAALVVAILVPFRSAIVAAVTKAMADVTGA